MSELPPFHEDTHRCQKHIVGQSGEKKECYSGKIVSWYWDFSDTAVSVCSDFRRGLVNWKVHPIQPYASWGAAFPQPHQYAFSLLQRESPSSFFFCCVLLIWKRLWKDKQMEGKIPRERMGYHVSRENNKERFFEMKIWKFEDLGLLPNSHVLIV